MTKAHQLFSNRLWTTLVAVLAAVALAISSASIASAAEVQSVSQNTHTVSVPRYLTSAQVRYSRALIEKESKDPQVLSTVNRLRNLHDGDSVRILSGKVPFTLTKKGNTLVLSGIYAERSFCGFAIASVLFAIGAVALFAIAATLGPGDVFVINGAEFTAEQLGYAGHLLTSFGDLADWAGRVFCD